MDNISFVTILTIILALIFDYTNGFHDTANAVATVISTRVLHPLLAVSIAALLNFSGAFLASRVAATITSGLISLEQTNNSVVLAAVGAAILWNLLTWRIGLPSSSSHALMGGIVGAGLAHAGFKAILWEGVAYKVILPMIIAPILSFVLGLMLMTLLHFLCSFGQRSRLAQSFRVLQLSAAAFKALAHGQSDAQKTMGLITMSLITSGLHSSTDVPFWVVCSCALAIALGTASGGWRIISTMGNKITKLEPVSGFAADTSAALIILGTSLLGAPISTTQVVTATIFGVGTARRVNSVRWIMAHKMMSAWAFTLPGACLLASLLYGLISLVP